MTAPLLTNSYRYDINGLRAWAVIAVLLYHFRLPGFSAGFIGVDLFFVISGYLMTQIIVSSLENQHFSLFSFYLSRLRRILPALGVLILLLFITGWFILPITNYQQLGQQAGYSIVFLSNIHYWLSSGYFDYSSQEKWLLHTWTLGVEFQFYLLYPLILLSLWKASPKRSSLLIGINLLFLCSLGLSLGLPQWLNTANFYLLPTRAWEFLAGGLCFFVAPKIKSPSTRYRLFLVGAGLWLVALLLIVPYTQWPSLWTILPVISTCSLLLAQQQHIVLRHPLAQWLGSRSYSLYLWHWPIFVALHFSQQHQHPIWLASGLALSLLFAELSYRWVETPTRHGLALLPRLQQSILFIGMGLLVGGTALILQKMTFTQRLPAQIDQSINQNNQLDPNWERCFLAATADGSPGCVYGTEDIGVIMVGDSHAASTISALGNVAAQYQKGALFWGLAACPTLDKVTYPSYISLPPNQCNMFNQWIDQQLTQYPNTPVVLVSRTSDYLLGPNEPEREHEIDQLSVYFTREYASRLEPEFQEEFGQVLIETACRLAQDRPVYLMRPLPEFGLSVPTTLFKQKLFQTDTLTSSNDVTIPLRDYHKRHHQVWAAQDQASAQCDQVHILDPLPYLCDKQFCYGAKNGQPFYFDDDHLNEYGNKRLKPVFAPIFLSQPSPSLNP